MREHKYRGKCTPESKYAGEWVVGSLVVCEDGTTLIVCAINDHNTTTYHVIPETVGEWTGRYDKSEPPKDIYEGDIIEVLGSRMAVTYVNSSFRLRECTLACYDTNSIEVIGNIHDNPDMISDFV